MFCLILFLFFFKVYINDVFYYIYVWIVKIGVKSTTYLNHTGYIGYNSPRLNKMPKLNFFEIFPKLNPCPNWFSIVLNCPGQISNLKLRNFREKVKFLQFKIHFKHLFDKLQLHWHANSNTLIKFWLITSKVMQVCRWVTRVHHARCFENLKIIAKLTKIVL